jgi:hypothetical protein
VLIIKKSNCINTASAIVFSASDRPVCRLRRNCSSGVQAEKELSSLSTCTPELQFLLNLHTGTAAPSQPAHRNCSSFSTCTPELQFLLNLHTGTTVPSQPAHRNCSSFPTCTPELQFLLNLHIGTAVPSQPAHRTVTYREYYSRCCINTI